MAEVVLSSTWKLDDAPIPAPSRYSFVPKNDLMVNSIGGTGVRSGGKYGNDVIRLSWEGLTSAERDLVVSLLIIAIASEVELVDSRSMVATVTQQEQSDLVVTQEMGYAREYGPIVFSVSVTLAVRSSPAFSGV